MSGKHPYGSDNLGKVLDDQMNLPLPSILEVRPELPPAVQEVLEQFCEKRREDRPASMEDAIALIEDLRPSYLDLAPIALRATAALVDLLLWGILWGAFIAFTDRIAGLSLKHTAWENVGTLVVLLLTQLGLEAWTGTSVGKYLFNLQAVRQDGGRPRFSVTLARFLCRFPVAVALPLPDMWLRGIIFLVQVVSIAAAAVCYLLFRRRTLSDLLTRTRVVYRGPPGSRERTA